MSVSGNRVTLGFKHLGGGLVAKDGDLKGFTIAGADGKFVAPQGDDRRRHDRRLQRFRLRSGRGSLWLGERAGRQSLQPGRLARLAVSDRRRVHAGARLRALLNGTDLTGWHYKDGAAVRRQDAGQRRALHGPRRPHCREPGQGDWPSCGRRASSRTTSS